MASQGLSHTCILLTIILAVKYQQQQQASCSILEADETCGSEVSFFQLNFPKQPDSRVPCQFHQYMSESPVVRRLHLVRYDCQHAE